LAGSFFFKTPCTEKMPGLNPRFPAVFLCGSRQRKLPCFFGGFGHAQVDTLAMNDSNQAAMRKAQIMEGLLTPP